MTPGDPRSDPGRSSQTGITRWTPSWTTSRPRRSRLGVTSRRRSCARIAREPDRTPPRRFVLAVSHLRMRSAVGAFRQLLRVTVGQGHFPVLLRAQALGLVLLTVVGAAVLGAGAAAGVARLLQDQPGLTEMAPDESPDTNRVSIPAPSDAMKSTRPERTPPAADRTLQAPQPTTRPARAARPTAAPDGATKVSSTPGPTRRPGPTRTPRPERTPHPTERPTPTDEAEPTETPESEDHGGGDGDPDGEGTGGEHGGPDADEGS